MKLITRFLTSAADPKQFPPPGPPEIAFLGRSNVGKSSLINSLLGEKVAHTSNTPGRTQTINFFAVRRPGHPHPEMIFADLPGYGYARVPRDISSQWPKFIEPYLAERPVLALCIALVDASVPPQNSDHQLIEWLQHAQRPRLIVATKADRVSGNGLSVALRKLAGEYPDVNILAFSAKTGRGREELWKEIRAAAAATAV